MAIAQEIMPTSSPQHKYEFALANLADSQTGTAVPILGGVLNTYILPKNGFIVGYAITKSAAHSAGSLDFDLVLNSTSTLTIAADTTSVYKVLEVPNEPFTAGQTLSVTYTSDGNLEANTVDVGVSVFVVFTDFDF